MRFFIEMSKGEIMMVVIKLSIISIVVGILIGQLIDTAATAIDKQLVRRKHRREAQRLADAIAIGIINRKADGSSSDAETKELYQARLARIRAMVGE